MNWVVQAPARNLRGDEKKLFARVRQTLWDYEPLRASHAEIVIGIRGGSVRLSGRVRTTNQKVLAELLTRRLVGVDDVTNDLIADPEVVRQVADALAADTRTAPYVLRVDSRHGVVSLQGDVPDEVTSQAALAIASAAPSVALVRNQLALGGPILPPVALIAESDQPALPG
jgi:osmotically-inducible protein OsmY